MTDKSGKKMDRRRSQRTLLVMPLAISWTTSTGMRVREHAETEVVSATGALLRMKTRIPAQGSVDLKRPATNQSAAVKVVSVSTPSPDGWIRVSVEFVAPNPSFWGITFPPLDEEPIEPAPVAKPTLASLMAARVNGAIHGALQTASRPTIAVPIPAASSANNPARIPAALRPQPSMGAK